MRPSPSGIHPLTVGILTQRKPICPAPAAVHSPLHTLTRGYSLRTCPQPPPQARAVQEDVDEARLAFRPE